VAKPFRFQIQALLAAVGLGAIVACGGGGSSYSAPRPVVTASPSPRPTASPTPTPSPSPTATSSPTSGSTTAPVVPGQPNFFPLVSGYGGEIEFPAGSTPTNDTITLETQVTQPSGYPTIPPSDPAAGSTAVSPWLTFQLAQPLTTPASSKVLLGICGPAGPTGTYYYALFDLTTGQFEGDLLAPQPKACSYPPQRALRALHPLISRNVVFPSDQIYLGLFYHQ
jgi:hypothetical protein